MLNEQKNQLFDHLMERFQKNKVRHINVLWEEYKKKIDHHSILNSIYAMEETGGEPDLVVIDNTWYIIDCSKETPKGRVSICYDEEARLKRKNVPPKDSAIGIASKIGITLLDEKLYRLLQEIEPFDTKTSSWIMTPSEIRVLGGALFADRRYNQVFVYHNGADSYYSVRGFRGYIKL
jgi:hypothetical protein